MHNFCSAPSGEELIYAQALTWFNMVCLEPQKKPKYAEKSSAQVLLF